MCVSQDSIANICVGCDVGGSPNVMHTYTSYDNESFNFSVFSVILSDFV